MIIVIIAITIIVIRIIEVKVIRIITIIIIKHCNNRNKNRDPPGCISRMGSLHIKVIVSDFEGRDL